MMFDEIPIKLIQLYMFVVLRKQGKNFINGLISTSSSQSSKEIGFMHFNFPPFKIKKIIEAFGSELFILFVHLRRWIYFWLLNPSSLMFFQLKLQYFTTVQQHNRLFYCYFCKNMAPGSVQVMFCCCYAVKITPESFQVLFLLLFMQKHST